VAHISRHVGRYEIVREVGRGGMAVVYLARQAGLDREVALKELAAFHVEDPAFVDRFLRESRLAGSLGHPNIVTVYDYFEHENVPYIAMEYLDRGSLRPFVGRLSVAQVAGVMEGVLAGLNHAGRRSVVHRDLKPENLLVTDEGGIKIADFGIAKALNQASLGAYRTATGMAIGTPAYMAPEQATALEVGPWTDLYTTGVIAYELLVGRVPFGGVDTPMAVLWKHVHEPPPPPQSVRPDLDPGLAGWLERMLAKEPTGRPPGATAAWEELEEIVIGLIGPRWRRDARLLERGADAATPEPLTPATFYEDVTPDTPVAESRPADRAPAAPPPPPPPPAWPPPSVPGAVQAPTVPPSVPPAADESFVWPAPERRRRIDLKEPAIAAALLVVALLASGLIYLLTGEDENATPTATQTTPTTPPPPEEPRFARAGAFSENTLGGEGDQAIRAAATDGDEVVAGGIDGSDPEGDAALWSIVGDQIRRLSGDALGGPGGQAINGLAQRGEVVVAVGWVQVGGDRDAAVWTSDAGGFVRACTFDSVCGDGGVPPDRRQEMLAVAVLDDAFVAVGRDTDPSGAGGFDAAVWRSSDGVDWQRIPLSGPGFSGPASQAMTDVVATGTGLVAVGRDGLDAAAWRSADAIAWEAVASDSFAVPGAQEMIGATVGEPGILAVGYDETGGANRRDAAVWTFDGTRWQRVAREALAAPAGQEMRTVTRVGTSFLAAGLDRSGDEQDAAVWTSPDGLAWERSREPGLGGEGEQGIETLIALADGRIIALGNLASDVLTDKDAGVWVREP
jgi:hypothetical protein